MLKNSENSFNLEKYIVILATIINMANYYQISKEFETETELAGLQKSSGGDFWAVKSEAIISENISATKRGQRGVVFLLDIG